MEGVVAAKRPGSTMMVSVSTNAQGQYSFPRDRLAPGAYDVTGCVPSASRCHRPRQRSEWTVPPNSILSAREGSAGRSRPANVQQRMGSKRTGHAPAEDSSAEVSGLSWPAASALFQGRCRGNGAHGAAHGRTFRERLSQFSFLQSERIREIERSAEQAGGGFGGLHRFDQSQFGKKPGCSNCKPNPGRPADQRKPSSRRLIFPRAPRLMTRFSTKRAMFGSPISSTNSSRNWIPRPAR